MRLFHEPEPDYGREALTFALGAAGGLALGLLLVRGIPTPQRAGRIGGQLRDQARTMAGRLRPARLRRMGQEQRELTGLEDRVLETFYADRTLGDRGIDVGAISPGIIELSGSVWTREEAERAVRVANGVQGVKTVVNRMEVEEEARQMEDARRRLDEKSSGVTSLQHGTARVGGMGTRRQGRDTDPDRPDDSQDIGLGALDRADRAQRDDEGYSSPAPRADRQPWRKNYSEDEVAPQDPHGKHARVTLDSPPQERNTAARVGQGMKPGEHLTLEQSDLPAKPHTPAAGEPPAKGE